jgi:hypothetical protein
MIGPYPDLSPARRIFFDTAPVGALSTPVFVCGATVK